MASDYQLRPALAEDEAWLVDLRRRTVGPYMARLGMATDDGALLVRVREHYADAQILCTGDERLGLFKAYRDGDAWLLSQIQLEPACQGRGLGEWLIRSLMDRARAQALPVRLHVLHGNPARRLYDRLGFREISLNERTATLLWQPGG
jgi:ribosomal protein S18 acetylase RimI-like enzyme